MMKWFLAAIILMVFAFAFKMGLLVYIVYALLGIYLLSRYVTNSWATELHTSRSCRNISKINPKNVEETRLTAELGESIAVIIEIENRGWLPVVWMLVEDLLPKRAMLFRPHALEVSGKRITVLSLRQDQAQQLVYNMKCNRRGYYQIGPTVLETGDLFGLHRRFRVSSQPNYLTVYPKTIPIEGYDVASRRPIGEVTMTYRLFEDPTRVSGIREYEQGDSFNRIHWKATARTGKLHSKIYEPSTVIGATILLDFHKDSYDPQHEPYRSELAITAAASVCNAVYMTGQQVGLISNGRDAADRIRTEGWTGDARTRDEAMKSAEMVSRSDRLQPVTVSTRVGSDQFIRIRETLARLELTDGLDFPSFVLETTSRLPRDATVIAILPEITAEKVIALSNLRTQGYTITVLVNLFEYDDFAKASGQLLVEGIEVRHLRDEQSVASICQKYAVAAIR